MWNFALIVACLGAGLALRRVGRFPADAAATLNAFAINVSLPALALHEIRAMPAPSFLSAEFAFPASMAWLVFAGSLPLAVALGRAFGWSPAATGALALTAGLGNTSFVGYPLVEALYGRDGLRHAMIADQLGSFLAVSTVGIAVAASCAGQTRSWRSIARRVLLFPPLLALALAFATRSWAWPEGFDRVLERLGGTLVPIALVSVGCQLRLDRAAMRRERWKLAAGLGYKLALAPAVVLGADLAASAAWGLNAGSLALKVSVVEAAMAPMVTAAILAADFDLDAELANLMVGLGIPLSLATVPLWARLLQAFA